MNPVRYVWGLASPLTPRMIIAGILGALAVGSSVALLATSAWLISRASEQPPILYLQIAIVGVRAFGIGRSVFRYAERLLSHDAAFRTLTVLRERVYERLLVTGPIALRPYRRGDLLSRMVADVDAVQDLSLRVLLPAIAALLVSLGAVGVAFWLLPAAGVVLAIALLIGGLVVPWITYRAAHTAQSSMAPIQGEMTAQVVDVFSASADILTSSSSRQIKDTIAATDAQLTNAQARSAHTFGLASGLGAAAQGLAVIGSILVAVPAVNSGALAGVNLAVLILLPLAAYEAVITLPNAALSLLHVTASARRVQEVMNSPATVTEPVDPRPVPSTPVTVTLEDVSTSYPDSDSDAVRGVTCHIRPGQTTALIGPSGAGKSTVAAVLERFLDYQGHISINGVELRDMDSDDVRHLIGMSGQNDHVFDNTLGENVRLARRDATDEEIWQALAAVRLEDWARSLPSGLQTPVGRHGSALSGGQRQRLALARAILRDFPVLILDEPTEHVDRLTADELMADFSVATSGRTLLLITHDPHYAEQADSIVRITAPESGR